MGKEGDEQFKDFYHDFFDVKINLLVDNILSKKSLKISLKNSYLSREEYEENKEYIEDIILMERIMIIADGINKNKTTGVKLAKSVGISVDEIYEWYVRGKDGEERFRIFSQIFELGVVLPRVLAFKKARDIGIPVKFLNKKLKKDLGSADYRNWQEHDIINQRLEFTESDGESIDEKKVKNFLEKSELFALKDRKIKSKDLKKLKEFLNDKSMPVVEISIVDNAN